MSPRSMLSLLAAFILATPVAFAAPTPAAATPPAATPPAAPAPVEKQTTVVVQSNDELAKEVKAIAEVAASAAKSAGIAAQGAQAALEMLNKTLGAEAASRAAAAEALAKAAAKTAEDATKSVWSTQVGVNVLLVSGNANAMTGSLSIKVDGSWQGWSVAIRAGGAYGQTTTTATSTAASIAAVTALNANLGLRGDRSINELFGFFVGTGISGDHVAKIETMFFGEFGGSLTFFDEKAVEGLGDAKVEYQKSKLKLDFGLRATRQSLFRYYPGATAAETVGPLANPFDGNWITAARFAAAFRYAITKSAIFTNEIEVLPDLFDLKENIRATNIMSLSAQITGGLSLGLGWKWRYIGKPAAGAVKVDNEVTMGVTYTF